MAKQADSHPKRSTTRGKSARDPIYIAIDKHNAAYGRMREAARRHRHAEETDLEKKDPAAWKAIDRKWNAANDHHCDLLRDVAAARPSTAEGLAAKIQYVCAREEQHHGWSREGAEWALHHLGRDAALAAPRGTHSEDYRRVRALLAEIRAEEKEEAAKAAAYRRSPEVKKQRAEQKRAEKKWREPPKFTRREIAARKHLHESMSRVIAALDPTLPEDERWASLRTGG